MEITTYQFFTIMQIFNEKIVNILNFFIILLRFEQHYYFAE